jgi:hypothetical protein
MPQPGFSRRIEVRVPSRDFSVDVQQALERLGYEFVSASSRAAAPDARIVASGRLRRLPARASEPVILFGGSGSRDLDDPRVVGVVRPPATIRELYPLLQIALEAHPRAAARVPAVLAARSFRHGIDAPGAIVTLSEGGCLLRSAAGLPGSGALQLQFTLPNGGMVHTRAEPRYQVGKESGLEFEGLPEVSRGAIEDFVMASLS